MSVLGTIFSNHLLNLCALGWFCAQFLKFILTWAVKGRVVPERLYGTGGMPSSHTSLVSSLMMGTARQCGYTSAEFAVSAVLAAIVIYDAIGVRRAVGRHANVINRMLSIGSFADRVYENDDTVTDDDGDGHKDPKKLNELTGHTPMEVLGGALTGITVSMVYNFFFYMQ